MDYRHTFSLWKSLAPPASSPSRKYSETIGPSTLPKTLIQSPTTFNPPSAKCSPAGTPTRSGTINTPARTIPMNLSSYLIRVNADSVVPAGKFSRMHGQQKLNPSSPILLSIISALLFPIPSENCSTNIDSCSAVSLRLPLKPCFRGPVSATSSQPSSVFYIPSVET